MRGWRAALQRRAGRGAGTRCPRAFPRCSRGTFWDQHRLPRGVGGDKAAPSFGHLGGGGEGRAAGSPLPSPMPGSRQWPPFIGIFRSRPWPHHPAGDILPPPHPRGDSKGTDALGNHTEEPSSPPDPPMEMGPGCPHREPPFGDILTLLGSLSSSFSLPLSPGSAGLGQPLDDGRQRGDVFQAGDTWPFGDGHPDPIGTQLSEQCHPQLLGDTGSISCPPPATSLTSEGFPSAAQTFPPLPPRGFWEHIP